eukprot:Gb_27490 [translate_table: standard]
MDWDSHVSAKLLGHTMDKAIVEDSSYSTWKPLEIIGDWLQFCHSEGGSCSRCCWSHLKLVEPQGEGVAGSFGVRTSSEGLKVVLAPNIISREVGVGGYELHSLLPVDENLTGSGVSCSEAAKSWDVAELWAMPRKL